MIVLKAYNCTRIQLSVRFRGTRTSVTALVYIFDRVFIYICVIIITVTHDQTNTLQQLCMRIHIVKYIIQYLHIGCNSRILTMKTRAFSLVAFTADFLRRLLKKKTALIMYGYTEATDDGDNKLILHTQLQFLILNESIYNILFQPICLKNVFVIIVKKKRRY